MPQRNEPVAIIGTGCRFPGDSDTPSKLWELLREPRDLLTKIPPDRFDAETFWHSDPEHHGTANVKESYFLSSDPRRFDAQFFGIQPKEAESIDPQQRMLMETVYESMCAAGQTIEGLQGSSTAVYVGLMCDDWSGMLGRDWDNFPTYTATGISRSIMSNRLSYFFDWHGPSMTIDTACSSSLVAVHQAVQTLRSGDSRVAIAAGANLILSPGMYIAESKLHMLSPTGRSRMWDTNADGYARGEGFASVVLKTLTSAIADGDSIECIIRETGVNQDGRTAGITMPSNVAQSALVKETYGKAGLDINRPQDRPQFFHAHGTGTQAGDPQEAEAISKAFFSPGNMKNDKLYVGSIKTIIGHTEGTAGLASLIGSSLALQNATIPPNMHFQDLSAKVAPFYAGLEIPTEAKPWPYVSPGHPRRASVNSFGFGGTNAHAILESYEPTDRPSAITPLFTPLTLSATSERALRTLLVSYSEFLNSKDSLNLCDIAWTLQSRRSTLPFKIAISGSTTQTLRSSITSELARAEEKQTPVGVRSSNVSNARILGVFTGQGAQWATMGRELIKTSPHVRQILWSLDQCLAELPEDVRPSWSIVAELLKDAKNSKLGNASLSQPLCTAVQIVLVDMLQSTGIKMQAVVGHSSGEIGAAYAAGFVSAFDAIRIAYYRGFYARLAQSPNGKKGAMMAVGTSLEDAQSFCDLESFQGRLVVAAKNSSASVTLSGDEDAVDEAIQAFNDEGLFVRKLNVDTAYHSFHMAPCSKIYLESLGSCKSQLDVSTDTTWFSSVVPGQKMTKLTFNAEYWVDNMTRPVMFFDAVAAAISDLGSLEAVIEVGPHPALKGPCLKVVEEVLETASLPYSGLLSRGKNDVDAVSAALAFLWTHLGASAVDFDAYDKLVSGRSAPRRLAVDLPSYPWDRQRTYWTESRISGSYRTRKMGPHPLLGTRCTESTTSEELQWRNLLRQKELPWLDGHKLQGQIVFPASGYAVMAVEAAISLVEDRGLKLVEIQDLTIDRAIAFSDTTSTVETLFSLRIAPEDPLSDKMVADFTGQSSPDREQAMSLNARGRIILHLGDPEEDSLPFVRSKPLNMVNVDIDRFYASLSRLGYNYSYPFKGISLLQRKVDSARGTLLKPQGINWEDRMLIHPGTLDTAFQTIFAAYCSPGDNRLWSLHVPTNIKRITINPYHGGTINSDEALLPFQAAMLSESGSSISADVEIFSENSQHAFVQIESVKLIPFSPASPEEDAVLFSKFVWDVAAADGDVAARYERPTAYEKSVAHDLERVCFFYLRRLTEVITPKEQADTLWHYRCLLNWAFHVSNRVDRGDHPYLKREWQHDTHGDILELMDQYIDRVDVKLIKIVGENFPKVIRDRSNILEYMVQDGVLSDFYEQGLGLTASNRWISRIVRQIAHRYPHMNVFEIGAGTGGATKAIIEELGSAFTSYTYTDISSGFFETARKRFDRFAQRMIFKTFDIEKDVTAQGYTEGSYELVVASNVLHATKELEQTMVNTRRLMKPGGTLVLLEVTNSEPLRNGLPMGGLTGWWVGVDCGRPWGPTLSLEEWDSVLRKTGFSGVDTTTPEYDTLTYPFSVFTTQALDDRVSYLRQPLTALNDAAVPRMEHLAIIGGKTLQTSELVKELVFLLRQQYKTIIHIESLDTVKQSDIPAAGTVLSLTDLDEATFKTFTVARHGSLKKLFTQAENMLWVTHGCRADDPFSNMMVGIGRAVRFEYPNINLQMLDMDDLQAGGPRVIAESLLRLQAIRTWKKERPLDDLVYSSEPEVSLQDQRLIIPRLLPNEDQNNRYNASRRLITSCVNPQISPVELVAGACWELRDRSWRKPWAQPHITDEAIQIQVTHSLLQSIKIGASGYLYLCLGNVVETGQQVLALSETHQSIVQLPKALTVAYDSTTSSAQILSSVVGYLFAENATSLVPREGTLVVHEPDTCLVPALVQRAADKGITLFCTTSSSDLHGPFWIYIHHLSTDRMIKQKLPSQTSIFVETSIHHSADDLGSRIRSLLHTDCTPVEAVPFFDYCPRAPTELSRGAISKLLQTALTQTHIFGTTAADGAAIRPLADIPGTKVDSPLGLVDWTSVLEVPVEIHPVDSEDLFRSDRSYLLVGLSGEVGQSLCQWMVEHGARYVVLTSRNPKVSQDWIDSLRAFGATVKAMPMDITDERSLRITYDEICQTLPPVAGVANGAMVLIDRTFENMEHGTMVDVLRPKVDGSKYLDQLFSQNTLDFFILFSSMSSVVGNSGQSNYIAANMYMTSLAFQRKKRGLAGSVIDISSLVGIGYVEHSDAVDAEYFTRIGYTNISEQDLHQMFAEAMLAGRPGHHDDPEIVTGLAPAYADAEIKAPYRSDLKFCHFTIERPGDKQLPGQKEVVPVKSQLGAAKTRVQVLDIIKASFSARLRQILQLGAEDELSETSTLVEQGVDSLVAVEVRSWSLKELDLDMPVLRILGGASMTSLLEDALDRISPTMIPNMTSTAEVSETPAVSMPANLSNENNQEPIGHDTNNQQPVQDHQMQANHDSDTSSSPPSELQQDTTSGSDTSSSVADEEILRETLKDSMPKELVEKMSFGQSRFWFLNQLLKDKTTFNMAFSARLEGQLGLTSLEHAVRAVGQKHEALRTRFFSVGEHLDQPLQGVIEASLVRLRHQNISNELEATQELQSMRDHIWDLEKWESLRITLLSLSETSHYLLVACHHIAMDGISFQVLLSDLDKAYNSTELEPCPPASQYRAFAAEQHSAYATGKMEADFDFYRQMIPQDPQPLPLFPFAFTGSRKVLESYGAHRADFRLTPALAGRIKAQARASKATTFHFYLAALQCLVFRLLENIDEVFIGIADANRSDSRFMGTLGFLLNLLPLRFQRTKEQSFAKAVQDARNKAYAALAHSKVPFDLLLNKLNITRSATYSPLFQIFFDYRQGVQERSTFAGCAAEGEHWYLAKTGYDLGLDIIDNAAGDSLVTLRLQESLYAEHDTKFLLRSYINILEDFSAKPGMPLERVELWRREDTDRAIALGSGKSMQLNWAPTLSHRVDEMIQQHGSNTAVKDAAGTVLSYTQMSARVHAIATALVEAKVTDGAKVGVFQEPSADWICSLLAIFRVGAVYVPLDLRTSLTRLATIVSQCKPQLILAHNPTLANTSDLECAGTTGVVNISNIHEYRHDYLLNRAQPSSPAVLLFTSGSTGTPKGIMINHSNLRNQMESYSREWNIVAGAAMVLQQSAFSFDFSFDQIFSALANGGGLYVASAAQRGDPSKITKLMADEGITYTSATPSEYLLWTQYGSTNLRCCFKWKYAFAGGEPLPERLVQDVRGLGLSGLHFFNNYGPAEITIASTKIEVAYNEAGPGVLAPAGFMLPNYSVYILDPHLKPLPVGFPGEIVIGGAGVSSGYLNNEALTKEKFIPDIFAPPEHRANGWVTSYRTGDRGRLREDGALICEGRIDGDTQVKFHGFRIELGDVESCILQAADGALSDAVVSVRDIDGSQFLIAHVVFSQNASSKGRDSFLRRLPSLLPLPQYMLPAMIVSLDQLPLTNHFKVDRQTVKTLPLPTAHDKKEAVELTRTECRLQDIWQKVLPYAPALSAETDFFLVGGNSLLLVKLQALIRENLNVVIELVNLMGTSTLGQMATAIENAVSVPTINWETEIELPETRTTNNPNLKDDKSKPIGQSENLVVLMTGSTGYLGRHMLPRLVTDSKISKIYCVALRHDDSQAGNRPASESAKVFVKHGNLTSPLLGLTEQDYTSMAQEVDLIIHSGASRSFWDSYEALRATNVAPTKELIKLALPRKVPIHFVSSSGVLDYGSGQPPTDGSNGYVASKWAANQLLAKAARDLGIPCYIHSPLTYAASSSFTPPQVLDELSALARKMQILPSFCGVQGSIDLIPVSTVIETMCSAFFEDAPSPRLTQVSHPSESRVELRSLVDHLRKDDGLIGLGTMPALEWVGQAKRNGFSYFIASQDIAMGEGDSGSATLVSRR